MAAAECVCIRVFMCVCVRERVEVRNSVVCIKLVQSDGAVERYSGVRVHLQCVCVCVRACLCVCACVFVCV